VLAAFADSWVVARPPSVIDADISPLLRHPVGPESHAIMTCGGAIRRETAGIAYHLAKVIR
jgi:hypothetical protein